MPTPIEQRTYQQGGLGIRVNRVAAADPQAAWQTIFTVTGGLVLVTGLVGVRTVIQAGGASNMQFRHSVGTTVLCVAAAITGNAVSTIYTVTGNPLDALVIGAAGVPIQGGMMGSQAGASIQQFGIIVMAGNIQVTMTAAAGTGSTKYILTYIPLEDASSVAPA
jgi:hypothetical protein